MTQCKISKIKLCGEEINLNSNDIVIFVGPNNVGKSQSLLDIYNSFYKPDNNVVISDIEFRYLEIKQLREFVQKYSNELIRNGSLYYAGYNYSIYSDKIDQIKEGERMSTEFRSFFVSKMETSDRLVQCNPVNTIDKGEARTHPLHYIVQEPAYREKISNSFHKAFGCHLQVERTSTKTNFLRIGDLSCNPTGTNYNEIIDELDAKMNSFPKLHEQGDGIKGFTGILLTLIMENYSIFLMDEPESFLHQPQAKILGNEIPVLLKDRQAFIATHSEALIRGIMEVAADRVKIVRITRDGNKNFFKLLNNTDIQKVWNDSLLKYSNVLESLFYKNVVICESDSDCMLYSIVLSHIKEQSGSYSETLFVYSSTKNRLKVIAALLNSLGVDFRVVPDIDILREQNDIRFLYESCGKEWDENIDKLYKEFIHEFIDEEVSINKENLKKMFCQVIDEVPVELVDAIRLKEIKSKVKLGTKWKRSKKEGVNGFPSDKAKEIFSDIDRKLKENHIYLVTEGELESFFPSIGGHGPGWVNNVLESYPNIGDKNYDKVKTFITSLNL